MFLFRGSREVGSRHARQADAIQTADWSDRDTGPRILSGLASIATPYYCAHTNIETYGYV